MKFKLIFVMALLAVLTACATDPTVKYKAVGDPLPDALIQDCSVTAPPARQSYLAAPLQQREKLLSSTLNGTYEDLTQCNLDKRALREWKARQQKLRDELEARKPQ